MLHRVGTSAYVIILLSDFGISLTFNIEDLVAYKGPPTIPDDPFVEPSLELDDFPIADPIPVLISLPLHQAQKKAH